MMGWFLKFLGVLFISLLIGGRAAEGAEAPPDCRCPPPLPPPRPPPGYREVPGLGLYKMHFEWLTWFAAKAACEREGGDLVVIDSQNEASMVQGLMGKFPGINYVHVGFLDVTANGTYVTVLGAALSASGYAAWASGEPSQMGRENCGALHRQNGFCDVLCKRELPFVCERHY